MGWTKFYTQNRSLTEPESWSRTPLENMTGVELIHNDKQLAIYGPGPYWQSDTFETDVVPFGSPPQKLVSRRIEKQISSLCFARKNEDMFGLTFDFREPILTSDVNGIWTPDENIFPLWLILELDVVNNKHFWYTSKGRI